MREASRKVEGGKLVKLRMDEETRKVTILGDFFLHPEESISELEGLFSAASPSVPREVLLKDLGSLLKKLDVQLIGFSPRDLVDLYVEVRE
jgi:hypothetical protein